MHESSQPYAVQLCTEIMTVCFVSFLYVCYISVLRHVNFTQKYQNGSSITLLVESVDIARLRKTCCSKVFKSIVLIQCTYLNDCNNLPWTPALSKALWIQHYLLQSFVSAENQLHQSKSRSTKCVSFVISQPRTQFYMHQMYLAQQNSPVNLSQLGKGIFFR